jgi:hypothetical protein
MEALIHPSRLWLIATCVSETDDKDSEENRLADDLTPKTRCRCHLPMTERPVVRKEESGIENGFLELDGDQLLG